MYKLWSYWSAIKPLDNNKKLPIPVNIRPLGTSNSKQEDLGIW